MRSTKLRDKVQIPLYRLPRDVHDKPVASPLAQIALRRLPRNFRVWEIQGKFRGSGRNGIWAKGDVTGWSRTCTINTIGLGRGLVADVMGKSA